MGLSNTQRLYDLVGRPLKDTPVIHVGGSNGKGSVCYKLAETLRLNGFRTGLFVSPHISSFRERIQVNAQIMDISAMSTLLPKLLSVCDKEQINASFFELTTILAMLAFDRAGCDAVVLEVGLGGRLDATNVIPNPVLSIITNIQLEHQRILGDTLPEIAFAKAGITKKGCPLLLGFGSKAALQLQWRSQNVAQSGADEPKVQPPSPLASTNAEEKVITDESVEVVQVMHDEAGGVRASSISHLTDVMHDRKYIPGKTENIDILNSDIATAALRLIASDTDVIPGSDAHQRNVAKFRRGLAESSAKFGVAYEVRPPCRFQTITVANTRGGSAVDVILDVAHTHDAIGSLCGKVGALNAPDVHVVIGMCADKNIRKCVEHVSNLIGPGKHLTNVHCVSSAQKRMMATEKLKALVLDVANDCSPEGAAWAAVGNGSAATMIARDEEQDMRIVLRQAIEKAGMTVNAKASSPQPRPVVLVCGSAFIMASAREELGIPVPRDPPL